MSSLADRRAAALEAFQRAQSQGYGFNNWPELAAELAALIPAPKAKGDLDRSAWADYKSPPWRGNEFERTPVVVVFEDGERFEFHGAPSSVKKPYNWGPTARIARDFWRLRIALRNPGRWPRDVPTENQRMAYERSLTPPAIVSMECNGVRASKEPG
jgi:hypothetical protein